MPVLMENFSYTPDASFCEGGVSSTLLMLDLVRCLARSFFWRQRAQSVVLVSSFSCTPDAIVALLFSPNLGTFSYTPDASFSEEFLLHSGC